MPTHSKQWWAEKTGYPIDEVPDTVALIRTDEEPTEDDVKKMHEIIVREQMPWWVWVLANHVFTPEGVIGWWERPAPMDDNKTPKQIWEEEGHEGILRVLEGLFFPVYT